MAQVGTKLVWEESLHNNTLLIVIPYLHTSHSKNDGYNAFHTLLKVPVVSEERIQLKPTQPDHLY